MQQQSKTIGDSSLDKPKFINEMEVVISQLDTVGVQIMGIGTATPETAFSQQEVLDLMGISDKRIRSMFLNSAIKNRYLTMPNNVSECGNNTETQGELLKKHREQALDIGAQALYNCLKSTGEKLEDVQHLCCVTSTGMLVPGLSALFCHKLGLNNDCNRLDIVGMGCNAGLNGLNATANWTKANPGKLAIVLCVEICSAAYVVDGSIDVAVVNSLFGDGASAAALIGGKNPFRSVVNNATILEFSSCIVTDAIDAMKFYWDDCFGKLSFCLARDVPYVVGAHIEQAVARLLGKEGLRKSDISHWIVHSGGKKVIDSIKVNLGLTVHDLRHTIGVLSDYGNVSSGSFLFSYQRLLQENVINCGDYGVMVTMGPGATIETALIQW